MRQTLMLRFCVGALAGIAAFVGGVLVAGVFL